MVQREELDGRVNGFGSNLGIAKAACRGSIALLAPFTLPSSLARPLALERCLRLCHGTKKGPDEPGMM